MLCCSTNRSDPVASELGFLTATPCICVKKELISFVQICVPNTKLAKLAGAKSEPFAGLVDDYIVDIVLGDAQRLNL